MAVFKFRNLKTSQAMPIPAGEFVIGRADNAYVHVDDPSVSRNHARLLNNEEGFFIEDLGSSNGTAFRGAFIAMRTKINFGNVVHIGSVPFRVDPEVEGKAETHPPPSSRTASAASMRRDTERIPSIGEAPWTPEVLAPDKLSAPEINPTESDAEELNAVTFRAPEPVIPAVSPKPQAAASPSIPANPTPVPVQKAASASAPTSQRSIAPRQRVRQQTPLEAEPPKKGSGWIWHLVIFLAGLGAGLLLGLIFAKIFFEMGGKPAGLP